MRRGINIRKKKKIFLNNLNKKTLKLLTLLILILLFCIYIFVFFVQDIFIKVNLEQDNTDFTSLNQSIPFSIRKIVLFSSATAESGTINQLASLDISQYCDIGIYLTPLNDTDTSISNLYIDNINISNPKIGTPYLYKKIVTDLGKCTFNKENIISNKFDFNIINNENPINYLKYETYSDGSTPITLGFYNHNIKTEFLTNKSEIIYNGTLLKEAIIPLSNLTCNISFTINIITTINEHYICNVNIDIPFEDINGSIYDTGYVTKEITSNETNKFIRIK